MPEPADYSISKTYSKSLDEREGLLRSSAVHPYTSEERRHTTVYKRRWYILLIFSIMASLNNLIWNTWGPIERSASLVYGWDEATIALLAAWGPLTFIIATLPMSWLMDAKGLRISVLLACAMELVGSGLRCITREPVSASYLIHTGQLITGLGGPVAMAAAPLVSAAWFPPGQRTTATAISSLACYGGTSLSFVIGPLFVTDVGNATSYANITTSMLPDEVKRLPTQIMRLLYLEFGVTGFVFLCLLVYFPDKPPLPPSITAGKGRLEFSKGTKRLMKNKNFWILLLLYGISTGIYGGWCSVLALNLTEFGIGQNMAGWLGCFAVLAGSVSGITLSMFADKFYRYMKLMLLALLTGATASLLMFSFLCTKLIPYNRVALYVTCILGGFFVNGTIPLFFELAVETTYPVAEGITTGFLTFSNNFIQVLFYLFLMFPATQSTKWLNWGTVAACGICLPFLLFLKARYYRSDVDKRSAIVTEYRPPKYESVNASTDETHNYGPSSSQNGSVSS